MQSSSMNRLSRPSSSKLLTSHFKTSVSPLLKQPKTKTLSSLNQLTKESTASTKKHNKLLNFAHTSSEPQRLVKPAFSYRTSHQNSSKPNRLLKKQSTDSQVILTSGKISSQQTSSKSIQRAGSVQLFAQRPNAPDHSSFGQLL